MSSCWPPAGWRSEAVPFPAAGSWWHSLSTHMPPPPRRTWTAPPRNWPMPSHFWASTDAFRDVARTVYHERVHQRLTQAFSLLGRPASYMKLGAYKHSYILRYLEEAAAESYSLSKTGRVRPGELTGVQFPLNGNYGVTLTQIGQEARGLVLGPVVVGQSILWASYGIVHDQR